MARTIDPNRFLLGGYMPNVLMRAGISQAAKVCYIALASFAGGGKTTCWPSQEALAAKYNSSDRSTREHLRELEEAGFISATQQGLNRVNVYEFFSLEDRESGDDTPGPGPAEIRHTGPEDPATPDRQKSAGLERQKSAGLERQKSAGPYCIEPLSLEPLSLEEEGKNGSDKAESSGLNTKDLALEDPPDVFLQNSYSRTRRGKFRKTGTHSAGLARFIALEDQYTPAIVRWGLLRYLDTDDPWLRKNSWPLPHFVNNFGQLTAFGDRPWSDPDAPITPQPPRKGSLVPGQAVAVTKPVIRGLDLAVLAQRWNELVPSQPVIWEESQRVRYHKSIESPKFAGLFVEMCERAERIVSESPEEAGWLTFHWLISESRDGIANWTKLAGKNFGRQMRRPAGRSLEQEALALYREVG